MMPNTPDPRKFYAATKLLLMPSLMENAGFVAMEAMTNGIPVLASNRGGLPETIGDAAPMIDIPARYTPETPRRAHGRGSRALGRDDHPPLGRRGRVRALEPGGAARSQRWTAGEARGDIRRFLWEARVAEGWRSGIPMTRSAARSSDPATR